MTDNEMLLISLGGLIRGAIAFALILDADSKHAKTLVATTQAVVLITTVFLGGAMGWITLKLEI